MPEPKGKSTYSRPSPAREAGRAEDGLGVLQVRYFRRMRPQHVYGVVVTWPKGQERRVPAATPPVTVRLLMAGAQVVPAELPLDPSDANAKATFYVTPLAKGWLRNERLEVLVGGRKVQEVPLPSKVRGQGLTWLLLALAILLPWFLLSYGKYSPLKLNKEDVESVLNTKQVKALPLIQQQEIRFAKDPVEAAQLRIPELRQFDPGQVLHLRLKNELPDYLTDIEGVDEGLKKVGEMYDNIVVWNGQYPIAFYVFVGLLLLALISFILHQDSRGRKVSRPIPVPRSPVEGVTTRRDEALAAEVQ